MKLNIEPWDGEYESACRIRHLIEGAYPIFQRIQRNCTVEFMNGAIKGYEPSAVVAKIDGMICGMAMFSIGPNTETITLNGCVDASKRHQGIGTALFDFMMNELHRYPKTKVIRASALRSCPEGIAFLVEARFMEIDQLHWSRRNVQASFPEWAVSKVEHAQASNLRFVSGAEYETLREDWDRALWHLDSQTALDIPSTIKPEFPPFEKWRESLESPLNNRANAILALDNLEPVGVLKLGQLTNGGMNINYTAVARAHRRRGLSTALKLKAFEHAAEIGAEIITTQNHHNNPMLDLNSKLGFERMDSLVEFTRSIEGLKSKA